MLDFCVFFITNQVFSIVCGTGGVVVSVLATHVQGPGFAPQPRRDFTGGVADDAPGAWLFPVNVLQGRTGGAALSVDNAAVPHLSIFSIALHGN